MPCALTQIKDGKHVPIAFCSTKLTDSQKNWAVIEKETVAVLVALRKFIIIIKCVQTNRCSIHCSRKVR